MFEKLMNELNELVKAGIATYEVDEEAKLVEINWLRYRINEAGRVVAKEEISELRDDINPEYEFDEYRSEEFLDEVFEYHKTLDKIDLSVWAFDWFNNSLDLLKLTDETFDEFMDREHPKQRTGK
jgi:hypothetical protein